MPSNITQYLTTITLYLCVNASPYSWKSREKPPLSQHSDPVNLISARREKSTH